MPQSGLKPVKKRPIYLDLFVTHFPITAIVSILHRLSGVFLFLTIPLLLWGLQHSLTAKVGDGVLAMMSSQKFKWIVWTLLSALFYHLLAGLRHLIMDLRWGESWWAARMTAKFVLIVSLAYSMGLGIWLWC